MFFIPESSGKRRTASSEKTARVLALLVESNCLSQPQIRQARAIAVNLLKIFNFLHESKNCKCKWPKHRQKLPKNSLSLKELSWRNKLKLKSSMTRVGMEILGLK